MQETIFGGAAHRGDVHRFAATGQSNMNTAAGALVQFDARDALQADDTPGIVRVSATRFQFAFSGTYFVDYAGYVTSSSTNARRSPIIQFQLDPTGTGSSFAAHPVQAAMGYMRGSNSHQESTIALSDVFSVVAGTLLEVRSYAGSTNQDGITLAAGAGRLIIERKG